MLTFNKNKQINPKISKYIKEQTNKSLEKYLNKQPIFKQFILYKYNLIDTFWKSF
jgi:hypothetical protein